MTTQTRAPADADARFRLLADQAPLMLWMTGPTGLCTFFNKEWLSFTGRPLADECGCGWLRGVHPDDRDALVATAQQALDDRAAFTFACRVRGRNGEYRWVLGHATPRFDDRGQLGGYIGTCCDISDRRGADDAMAGAQRRLGQLIDNAQDMVYRVRLVPTQRIEYVSGAAEAITGHRPEAFYADPDLPRKAIHPSDAHLIDETFLNPGQLKSAITLRWVHADGSVVWAEHRRAAVFDAAGRVVAIEGIARDITERVLTQARLHESEEQMRQLAARVQSAREEERAALARELHDELGQTLTAIKLELGRTTAALRHQQLAPSTVDRLQSLVGLIEIGITIVKRIATNLRPATLDHLGLAAAIRWESMTFRARTGLRCHVSADKDDSALTPEQQTMVFRIYQEALTNIVRHARASAVHVTLVERGGQFELKIRDNGVGITEAQMNEPSSIGLLGMRERAALVGGSFAVAGRRGKGTTVVVRIPLETAASPRSAKRPRAATKRRRR